MVIKEEGQIRFRKDLHTASDLVYEEALAECRAQLERCLLILGRAPDTGGGDDKSPLGRAMQKACDEYGLASDFARRQTIEGAKTTFSDISEKWASRKIYMLDFLSAYQDLLTDSVTQLEQYDPFKFYAEDRPHFKQFPEGATVVQAWHPGWVDYYMYRQGDYGPRARNFIVTRTVDVEFLCSDRMRNWIKEHHIELVNYRDALYGTNEYQNHLKDIGSDLCVI
jgi:predicted glycoside hydrolase/deacetylase ChbG (UPF0249 family)